MDKLLSILIVVLIPHFLFSQEYTLKQQKENFILCDEQTNKTISLPKDLNKELNNSVVKTCSPNGKYVVFINNYNVSIYSIQQKTKSMLMSLHTDSKAVSQIEWYGAEDKFAFVNFNPKRYKKESKLFVLGIEKGKLASKQKFEVDVDHEIPLEENNFKQIYSKFNFNDKYTIYYTPRKPESYLGMILDTKYILIDKTNLKNKYNFFMFAEALPADFFFKIIDKDGNEVELPKDAQNGLISPSILSISPDDKYLIYAYQMKIMSCNISTGEINYLMSLHEDSDGTSNIRWSESGNKLAFININQNRYPEMCKIFVLDLNEGKLIHKNKYDAPAFFHCGAQCHAGTSDFKFLGETKIQYKRHEMIEDRPGEIDYITID